MWRAPRHRKNCAKLHPSHQGWNPTVEKSIKRIPFRSRIYNYGIMVKSGYYLRCPPTAEGVMQCKYAQWTLFSCKEPEIMTCKKYVELENTWSEVTQAQKDKSCILPYMQILASDFLYVHLREVCTEPRRLKRACGREKRDSLIWEGKESRTDML